MRNRRRGAVYVAIVAVVFATSVIPAFSQTAAQVSDAGTAKTSSNDEVSLLKRQVAEQQKEIEALQATMKAMKDKIDQGASAAQSAPPQAPSLGQVAGLTPMVPVPLAPIGDASAPLLKPMPNAGAAPVTQEQAQGYTKRVDTLEKSVQALNKGVAGLRFSGDFRYRFDGIWRTADSVGGPQQNVRERYRLRFNVDKAINNQFDAHFQLGSGTFNNPLTFDTDFAGANNRGPLFITEYWGSYHNQHVDLRGGKMPEVFADNSRFFFDDDLRLNGFQETAKAPLGRHGRVEFRAGQYVLTNPNVPILPSAAACTPATPGATVPANCAYLAAGFTPGQKVRDTNLFDQGIALIGDIKEGWSHQFITNIQLWRNPNGIQLASLASGFPVLVNGYYGVQVSSGPPETGTATTAPGGSIFTARRFQVGRINYRITHTGWKTSRQNVPVWLDLQASDNFGVGFARSAWMGTISIGEVKKAGDVRFLYQYGVKDANSMIAQVTDDDFGTGTGVNIRTHGIRLDLGINKFLEWDNKFWIQDPARGSDPARHLFVTVPAGVNTLYRIQSEFNVKF